jgi:hypothetical protein
MRNSAERKLLLSREEQEARAVVDRWIEDSGVHLGATLKVYWDLVEKVKAALKNAREGK